MSRDIGPNIEPKPEDPVWHKIDDVISAIDRSLRVADDKLSQEQGTLRFVVSEFSMSFPAEINVLSNKSVAVRLPSQFNEINARQKEGFSQIHITLRPTINMETQPKEKNTNKSKE